MHARRLPSTALRPLLLLLVAVAVIGCAWALIVPPFQAPDEQSHFGYAQVLAERGELPGADPGQALSTEQAIAAEAVNSDQLAGNTYARPTWSERAHAAWAERQERLPAGTRADGGGVGPEGGNPARSNPPLYYAYESIAYAVAAAGDLFARLYAMRLWSVLLLLAAVGATWALIGELVPNRRELQLAGAAVVGLQPMATFISASLNPDALVIAAFATTLWLGARTIRRGLTPARGVALCAAAAIAILAKGTGYALLPGVALALAAGARRAGMRPAGLARAGMSLLALAVPVGAWLAYAQASGRPAVNQVASAAAGGTPDQPGPLSYLWQFYLPHLPWQQPLPAGFPPLPALDFWLEGGWGRFGWLEIELPGVVYALAGTVTVAVLAGAVLAVVRAGLRRHAATIGFLGLVALALLAGLHLTEYRMLERQGASFNQGRYLLPLLPLLGLATAASLRLLSARWRSLALGAVLGLLVALQLASLAIVAARFHA